MSKPTIRHSDNRCWAKTSRTKARWLVLAHAWRIRYSQTADLQKEVWLRRQPWRDAVDRYNCGGSDMLTVSIISGLCTGFLLGWVRSTAPKWMRWCWRLRDWDEPLWVPGYVFVSSLIWLCVWIIAEIIHWMR